MTDLLADDPNEVGNAVQNLNDVVGDVQNFVADNQEALGTTSDKLASVTQAVNDSLDDVKQLLHVAPTAFQNFLNIYQPAQGTLSGALAVNNFANTIQFLCCGSTGRSPSGRQGVSEAMRAVSGADHQKPPVQLPAAGRESFRRSLSPSQRTHLQRGLATTRLRSPAAACVRPGQPPASGKRLPLAAHHWPQNAPGAQPVPTNPSAGLRGMMTPPGGGR